MPNPHLDDEIREHTLIWVRSLPIRYDKILSVQQHSFFCDVVWKYPDMVFNHAPVDNSGIIHALLSIYSSDFSDTTVDEKVVHILKDLKKKDRWLPAIAVLQQSLSETEASKLLALESLLN